MRGMFSDSQIALNPDATNLSIAAAARQGRKEFANSLYFCCLGKLEVRVELIASAHVCM